MSEERERGDERGSSPPKREKLPPFQPDPRLVVMVERGINPRQLKKLRADIEAMIER
jgi:hypothetical protein